MYSYDHNAYHTYWQLTGNKYKEVWLFGDIKFNDLAKQLQVLRHRLQSACIQLSAASHLPITLQVLNYDVWAPVVKASLALARVIFGWYYTARF